MALFLIGALLVVAFGSFPNWRPGWIVDGKLTRMGMPITIEIVMLTTAALIVLLSRIKAEDVFKGSVALAGNQAVVAIFGIAWMGDTFFAGNMDFLGGSIKAMVTSAPWLFALALFVLSIFLYSQAATVRALMPLGSRSVACTIAYGNVPLGQRILLYSELSHNRCGYQLRPNGHNAHWTVRS